MVGALPSSYGYTRSEWKLIAAIHTQCGQHQTNVTVAMLVEQTSLSEVTVKRFLNDRLVEEGRLVKVEGTDEFRPTDSLFTLKPPAGVLTAAAAAAERQATRQSILLAIADATARTGRTAIQVRMLPHAAIGHLGTQAINNVLKSLIKDEFLKKLRKDSDGTFYSLTDQGREEVKRLRGPQPDSA